MSEGKTHGRSSDLAPARKRTRRQRRADEGQRVAMMGSFTAVMLVGYVVTSGVATAYTPELRALVYKSRRLGWDVTTPESFPLQMLYTGYQQLLIPFISDCISRSLVRRGDVR